VKLRLATYFLPSLSWIYLNLFHCISSLPIYAFMALFFVSRRIYPKKETHHLPYSLGIVSFRCFQVETNPAVVVAQLSTGSFLFSFLYHPCNKSRPPPHDPRGSGAVHSTFLPAHPRPKREGGGSTLGVRGNVLRRRQGWPDLEAPKGYNPQRITLNQAYSLVVFLLVVEGETGSKKNFVFKKDE
jgi:hypothetical protein